MSAVTISPECEAWMAWQDTQFMVPAVEYFGINECVEYGLVDDDGIGQPGYYGRLSAPGYMDATDWDGPHHSREAALMSLFEMWGDDMPESETDNDTPTE